MKSWISLCLLSSNMTSSSHSFSLPPSSSPLVSSVFIHITLHMLGLCTCRNCLKWSFPNVCILGPFYPLDLRSNVTLVEQSLPIIFPEKEPATLSSPVHSSHDESFCSGLFVVVATCCVHLLITFPTRPSASWGQGPCTSCSLLYLQILPQNPGNKGSQIFTIKINEWSCTFTATMGQEILA